MKQLRNASKKTLNSLVCARSFFSSQHDKMTCRVCGGESMFPPLCNICRKNKAGLLTPQKADHWYLDEDRSFVVEVDNEPRYKVARSVSDSFHDDIVCVLLHRISCVEAKLDAFLSNASTIESKLDELLDRLELAPCEGASEYDAAKKRFEDNVKLL